MAYVQSYKATNFQNYYTIDMSGGTGTSTGTWTVVESLASFPTVFPVVLEIWDTDETFNSTVEFVICTAASVGSKQLTISTRGVDGTSAFAHANGSKVALNISALPWNNMVENVEQLKTDIVTKANTSTITTLQAQGNVQVTAVLTTAEAYSATSTDPNGGGAGLPVVGPTILQHTSLGLFKPNTTLPTDGALENLCVAFEASTGAAESHRVYLPGSIVAGFTGLVEGNIYYPSQAVAGAWSRTVGDYFRLAGRAMSATSMLILEGRTSRNLQDRGTLGTLVTNAGTNTAAARADHEHKVFYHFTPIVQSPSSGSTSVLFANKTSLTFDIVTFYAMTTGTLGTTLTTISLEKMAQTTVDGAFTPWTTITSPNLTIDANERSSNTAATPVTIGTPTLAPGEHLRMNVITAGSSIGDIQGFVVLKLKNTN